MKTNKEKEIEFYHAVGMVIKQLRNKAGITQDDLAGLIGISRVALNSIEKGKQRLPLHKLGAVCWLFEVKYSYVLPINTSELKKLSDLFEEKTVLVKKQNL